MLHLCQFVHCSLMTALTVIALGCTVEQRSSDSGKSNLEPESDPAEQEATNKRRELLRKSHASDNANRATAERTYLQAQAENIATIRLRGARGLAERLPDAAIAEYKKIAKEYPGTQAARDAQDLVDGKSPPARPTPADPDNAKAISVARFSSLTHCVDLAAIEDFGSPLQQIPATVIDKGVLKHVPYQSFRAGGYELNIYGDPESPACLEIGIDKTLIGKPNSKEHCLAFLASLLPDARDRCLLKSLNLTKDLQKRADVTFEVTPETAADAYGSWWISVYDPAALNKVRASPQELAAITVGRDSTSAPNQQPWSSNQLALARPGAMTVYVKSYTKKDGTFVQGHARSSPRRR